MAHTRTLKKKSKVYWKLLVIYVEYWGTGVARNKSGGPHGSQIFEASCES